MVVIGILGYAAFELRSVVSGPSIEITYPKNGEMVSTSLIHIEGKVSHINELSINSRKITMDESGVFKETLLLSSGLNVILIVGKDQFGRSTRTELTLIYK